MKKLTQDRIKLAEYERSIHAVSVPESVTVEDIQAPEFWAHVTNKLKPQDRIEAKSDDGSWFAELLVISVGPMYAKVFLLNVYDLVKIEQDIPTPEEKFFVKFGTSATKFRVHRKSDKEVLRDGFATKAEAEAWGHEHFKLKAA